MLDEGEIVEFDAPYLLLQKPDGLLSRLVELTGKAEIANLKDIALRAYEKTDNTSQLVSALVGSQHTVSAPIDERAEIEAATDEKESAADNTKQTGEKDKTQVEHVDEDNEDEVKSAEADQIQADDTVAMATTIATKESSTDTKKDADEVEDDTSDTEETKLLDKHSIENEANQSDDAK